MREISREEAARLLESGEAGFYAIWANPPVPHETQHVLQIRERFWLMPIENLKIGEAKVIQMNNGKLKQVHEVHMELSDEMGELLRAEMEEYPKVDVDGIPAYHTQK